MTVTAWCKQNGICEQTYYRNLRKLREEACGSFPVPAQSDKPAVFKQLQPQQPVSDGKAAILIHLPYATLEVHNGVCMETLEATLAARVREQFRMDPFSPSLFLFCGRRCDRIKALLWEGDGFVLLYKRLENGTF